jgi:hypothetical protein
LIARASGTEAARLRASTRARGPRVRPPERAPWRGRRRPKPRTQ